VVAVAVAADHDADRVLMPWDDRTAVRADALLELALDCVDPTRCAFKGFVAGGEPSWWASCDMLAVWVDGPTPQGFEAGCLVEYGHTFNIGVRVCCPGAAYDPEVDQEEPDWEWISQRSRYFRKVVDTLLDCIACKNNQWVGADCRKKQQWSVATRATDTEGCYIAILSTTVGEWTPDCCFTADVSVC
jgi:hypothetical protein